VPAVGAIGATRSIAKLYASLGELLSFETLRLATSTLSQGRDEAHDQDRRFGVGFELQTDARLLGPPEDAFGHTGAGGSVHGCWPSAGLGFSYAMNLLRDDEGEESRAAALLGALEEAIQ
jgi:CubicO group peptidase (beta-lactamase class C family)